MISVSLTLLKKYTLISAPNTPPPVYEQRDAAEYYEKILGLTSPDASQVKKTLSTSKELGFLKKKTCLPVSVFLCFQIFHGLLTHKTICSACRTETDTDGAFWHLSLALVDYSEHCSVVRNRFSVARRYLVN